MTETPLVTPAQLIYENGLSIKGSFTMKSQSSIITFQWEPENCKPFDFDQNNLEEASIFIFLHKTKRISRIKTDNGEISLRFAIPDYRTFSRFVFPSSSALIIDNMINTLFSLSFIESVNNEVNSFNVLLSTTKHFRIPPNTIGFLQAQCLYSHRAIVQKLVIDESIESLPPLTNQELFDFIEDGGNFSNFNELKKLIFRRGLTYEARLNVIWYLLGIFDPAKSILENKEHMKYLNNEYLLLLNRWKHVSASQKKYGHYFYSVILSDVARTDRTNPMFSSDQSPALKFLEDVLVCFALGQPDTGYTQGMGDLVACLMQLFIKTIIDDKQIEIYNETILPFEEVESMVFWSFVGLLNVTSHNVFFSNMDQNHSFFSERVFSLVQMFHPAQARWLVKNEQGGLLFTLSPLLLLFKRTFAGEKLWYLWDRIISADDPPSYLRLFMTSVVLSAFPSLVTTTSGDSGEVSNAFDGTMHQLNISKLVAMSYAIEEKVRKESMKTQWIFMKYPQTPSPSIKEPSMIALK